MRTTRVVLPKSTVSDRLRKRRKKKRKRKKCLLSLHRPRPRAVAALARKRFFSRARRRNISPCGEKDRGVIL
ncbi:hypothetical protein BHE74_00002417 [Ensete ventricosum]|nr:hypothetical protein GW17_00004880 [Ensete ventricosum]RWW88701.1 hypothetical protein BHE74_00002417 [Ensete ventricosum]RZS06339.1 hypothetical protein BHM03_00036981 [Ensete ventricosum]